MQDTGRLHETQPPVMKNDGPVFVVHDAGATFSRQVIVVVDSLASVRHGMSGASDSEAVTGAVSARLDRSRQASKIAVRMGPILTVGLKPCWIPTVHGARLNQYVLGRQTLWFGAREPSCAPL